MGSIIAQLTSCFICLDSAALIIWNEQQIYLFGWTHISQISDEPYSERSLT